MTRLRRGDRAVMKRLDLNAVVFLRYQNGDIEKVLTRDIKAVLRQRRHKGENPVVIWQRWLVGRLRARRVGLGFCMFSDGTIGMEAINKKTGERQRIYEHETWLTEEQMVELVVKSRYAIGSV